MTKVKDLHEKWSKDPKYQQVHDAMQDEFSVASAILDVRQNAGLTQKELADRMQATQSVVARLEGGTPNTTLKTLQRVAEATGTHLKISFEQPSR
jgi:transcriptional regulator with XRE-family HTH domain